jgi:hypothetical protein
MSIHEVSLPRPTAAAEAKETTFVFSVSLGADISHLHFCTTERYIHAVWNQKNQEKGIYLSCSNDSGKTFTTPRKIISTNGDVRDLQLIGRDEDIVITLIENVEGFDWVRAATGLICDDMTCKFKPCEKVQVEGELINAYTFFTKDASADHIYFKKKENKRSGPSDSFEIYRREVRHCTRLKLVQQGKVE